MRIRHLALGAVGLLLLAPAAGAQDEQEEAELGYTRDGWYFGVQAVRALASWEGVRTDDSGAWGMNSRLGWRFREYWALEFQFEYTAGFKLTGSEADIYNYVFSGNGKFYYPLGRLHPFATVGIGLIQRNISDIGMAAEQAGLAPGSRGDFAARLGLGCDIYLTEKIVLTGDAIWVTSGGESAQEYFSFGWGLQYRFAPFIY